MMLYGSHFFECLASGVNTIWKYGDFDILRCSDIGTNNVIRYFILVQKELIDLIESINDKYFKQARTKSIKIYYPIAIGL
jgi:hypothetical protein